MENILGDVLAEYKSLSITSKIIYNDNFITGRDHVAKTAFVGAMTSVDRNERNYTFIGKILCYSTEHEGFSAKINNNYFCCCEFASGYVWQHVIG